MRRAAGTGGEELLRRAPRRDDLIGGAAGQFGHVVEFEVKGAGARGGGTNFHDQVADLGFRHHRPHCVPAFPAFARIEAEDLAAPAREQRIDLRRRL